MPLRQHPPTTPVHASAISFKAYSYAYANQPGTVSTTEDAAHTGKRLKRNPDVAGELSESGVSAMTPMGSCGGLRGNSGATV